MTNPIKSYLNESILSQACTWIIKSERHLDKFIAWLKKKKLQPGDKILDRIFKKYWRKKGG